MKIRIYEYDRCDTCRKAIRFLQSRDLEFERVPIVERPPSRAELKRMLEALGGDLKRLFNTSGEQYRALGISAKLPKMTETEALELLSQNGKLVKRPFVLAGTRGVVGFKEEEWKKLLG